MDDHATPAVRLEGTEVRLTHERRAERLGASARIALVGAFCALAIRVADPAGGWMAVFYALLVAAPLLGVIAMQTGRHAWERGGIEATPESIVLARLRRRLGFRTRDVASAWIAPTPSGLAVEFRMKNGATVAARVPDFAAAHRVLDAARLDVAQRTCTLRLGQPRASLFATSFLLALLPVSFLALVFQPTDGADAMETLAGWFVAMALVTAVAQVEFGPVRLTLGADGLTLRQRGRTRVVRYADVLDARLEAPDVVLVLRDGSRVIVPTKRVSGFDRDAAYGRICDALRAWQRGGGGPGLELLERQGRGLDAWRAALASVVGRADGYRSFALERDDVVRALEDPSAPTERRIGAALALRAAGDREASERIRVAAEASAEPRVRVALGSLAEGPGDDAAIEQAVGEAGRRRA